MPVYASLDIFIPDFMKTKTLEEIEQEMYEALMAEVPGLQPLVARGLAKTADRPSNWPSRKQS